MPPTEELVSAKPFLRNAKVVSVLLSIFAVVGALSAIVTGDLTTVLTWFWVGIGLAITYLLLQIAVTIEQLRLES